MKNIIEEEIKSVFKPKDVGVGMLNCISEDYQIEELTVLILNRLKKAYDLGYESASSNID